MKRALKIVGGAVLMSAASAGLYSCSSTTQNTATPQSPIYSPRTQSTQPYQPIQTSQTRENTQSRTDHSEVFKDLGELADEVQVSVNGGKDSFVLKHQGNGLYRGRNNKLAGSEVVELYVDYLNGKTRGSITEEASLFSPEKRYDIEVNGWVSAGRKYDASNNGKIQLHSSMFRQKPTPGAMNTPLINPEQDKTNDLIRKSLDGWQIPLKF